MTYRPFECHIISNFMMIIYKEILVLQGAKNCFLYSFNNIIFLKVLQFARNWRIDGISSVYLLQGVFLGMKIENETLGLGSEKKWLITGIGPSRFLGFFLFNFIDNNFLNKNI